MCEEELNYKVTKSVNLMYINCDVLTSTRQTSLLLHQTNNANVDD